MSKAAAEGRIIGTSVPRREIRRLARGRGRYTDDIEVPRMLHAAFVRSPHAHARILSIDAAEAAAMPGVARVITGADVAEVCTPLVASAANRPGHKSAPQHVIAIGTAFWQGEPVAAIVAESRAVAEDAAERVFVDFEALEAVVDMDAALLPESPVIHAALGDNLAYAHTIEAGDGTRPFDGADVVVAHEFDFGRQTAVTLEPRTIIADYVAADDSLTVHQSHQSPHQMQDIYSRHLGIDEHRVRVIAPDVGGGFGLKINTHGDEIAIAAISRIMGRPIKFTADRLESFTADIHSRDHRATARLAVSRDGDIEALEVIDRSAIGPFTAYVRFGIAEGMMAITNAGAPYKIDHYRGEMKAAYVNKGIVGVYRGVGVPIACVITEQLVDFAAHAVGMDPVAFRRRNYHDDDSFPLKTAGGIPIGRLSLRRCLDSLVEIMDYDGLRAEQARRLDGGVYRGIGVATFIEATAYGPGYYGPTEARVSTQEGATVRLEPSGKVRCITSLTDQGQGTLTGVAQIVADRLGLGVDDVDVFGGDSAMTPYGGGAWASRGISMGGEAALIAADALKDNILALAGPILQADAATLDLAGGHVVDKADGAPRIALAEIGRIGHFRQDLLPAGLQPELAVTRSHVNNHSMFYVANGVQGCHVEIDPETGMIRVLGHWVADDCGRVINPLQVDEQLRGGVVQGIGATLYEHCQYDETGQMLNATLADYLVPMASEMPDIGTAHVETPEESTTLGAKGIGEAGTIGAIAAVWLAVNDALRPLGARIGAQPFTPARVLKAIAAAGS
jgi:carbon-monoxide dehydrogenase large subunit